jgi:hypothetical protein
MAGKSSSSSTNSQSLKPKSRRSTLRPISAYRSLEIVQR